MLSMTHSGCNQCVQHVAAAFFDSKEEELPRGLGR